MSKLATLPAGHKAVSLDALDRVTAAGPELFDGIAARMASLSGG